MALVVKNPPARAGGIERHGFNPWVRKSPGEGHGHPLQLLLPGESHGQRSLAGYHPRGCKESDTTERIKKKNRVKDSPGRGPTRPWGGCRHHHNVETSLRIREEPSAEKTSGRCGAETAALT